MRRTTVIGVMGALAVAFVGGGGAGAAEPRPLPEVVAVEPAAGPASGGGRVTVTGTGFVPGETWVLLEGLFLDVEVASSTSLSFVMPAHAPGTVRFSVVVSELESVGALTYLVEGPNPSVTPTRPTEVVRADVPPAVTPRPAPRADRPDRPVVTREEPPVAGPPTLAATGTDARRTGVLGVLAIVVGAVLVRIGRIRRCAEGTIERSGGGSWR